MSEYEDEVVAVATAAGSSVDVVGDDPFALRLRARLGEHEGQPDVVVVASGGDVEDALGRVADLGTVVLAGPAEHPAIAVDLYVDLHSRGITLVGMPGPSNGR